MRRPKGRNLKGRRIHSNDYPQFIFKKDPYENNPRAHVVRGILAGVPPASFQTYIDNGHELLALLFSKSWQRVPSQRPDMQQFLSELKASGQSENKSLPSVVSNDLAFLKGKVSSKKKHGKAARKRGHIETNSSVTRKSIRQASRESRRQRGFDQCSTNNATTNESESLEPRGQDINGDLNNRDLGEGRGLGDFMGQVAELRNSAPSPSSILPSLSHTSYLEHTHLDPFMTHPLTWSNYPSLPWQQEGTEALLGPSEKIALPHTQITSDSDSALGNMIWTANGRSPAESMTRFGNAEQSKDVIGPTYFSPGDILVPACELASYFSFSRG
jgi:hypothetical protein